MYRLRLQQIAERVFRAFDVRGPLPEEMAGQFDLSITAEDLTQPEYQYLRRTLRFAAFSTVPSNAGTFCGAGLVDPTPTNTPGVIAVVEKVVLTNPTAAAVGYLVGAIVIPSNVPQGTLRASPQDGRIRATNTSSAFQVIGRQELAIPGSALYQMAVQVPANATVFIDVQQVLIGGQGYWVSRDVNTAESNIGFFWRERQATDSELR